jgi:PAS domain S-box-containing protein
MHRDEFTADDWLKQYSVVADQIPLLAWVADKDGNVVHVNTECNKVLGTGEQEIQTEEFYRCIHIDDLASFQQCFRNAIVQQTDFSIVTRLQHGKSGFHPVQVKGSPFFTAGQVLAGMLLVAYKTNADAAVATSAKQASASTLPDTGVAQLRSMLQRSNEELQHRDLQLAEAKERLANLNRILEEKIADHTSILTQREAQMQALNEELKAVNEELSATNEELQQSNEELYEGREQLQNALNELLIAKAEVERSEQLFRSIAFNIPNSLVIVVDTDLKFITVDGDMAARLGYHPEKVKGKTVAEVIPELRFELVRSYFDRMLSGEKVTAERKAENGSDFLVSFVPLRNDHGVIYAGLVIALDITTIKDAERKSAHLAAIVASSDDAIVSKSLDSIVNSWNQAAERLFGYTAEEMVGQSILKLIPEERRGEEDQIIERLRRGERVDHFETIRQTKDGRMIDVSLTISPVKDNNGVIIGASKIARDITEQKKDETRKNDFIGMVSHELKTPLTTLTAIIQLLKLKLQDHDDSFIAGAADMAHVQTKRMSNLINGFLDISRLESGKLQMEEEVFEMESLIRDHIKEASFAAPDHTILFEASGSTEVMADKDKIGSVVSNLINNATKYAPVDKPILVTCTSDENAVLVSVKDAGVGIDEQDLTRIFDRYYRVESGAARKVAGFGIGLYLCSEIVARHGGQIWAESEPGKGSTFLFRLPRNLV